MRSIVLAALMISACTSDSGGDEGADESATGTEESTGDSGETGETTDGSGTGDSTDEGTTTGEGDPEDLPTPTGTCPTFADGEATFAPADIDSRGVRLWMADDPIPGGPLIIYWHATGSQPEEASYTLSTAVIAEITAAGGIVAAPEAAADVGQFPWFIVNGSPRQDDMIVADEIVACAIEQVGIDPGRIHTSGMSAGGLQTSAFSMARSSYIASASSFSGGVFTTLPFQDPSNHFAAMIFHGGDTDIYGGSVNFKDLSINWYDILVGNGNFAFMCDHGGGHTIPQGVGDDLWTFFQDHPYGTEPSPYAAGLPAEFPSYCAL